MDDRRLQKRVLDKIGCNVKTWTLVVKENILDVLI
jgi:phosphoribosylaminoimidazole carboxylase (NCAIR synthetase)